MLSTWLQTTRGRLAVLLAAVAVVVLGSAALAHFAFDLFDSYGAALWSAVLHLLDPSSLHDDEGAAARSVGVFQVVTGLVLLVGLLFTFVAETVGSSLERLGQRDRPVRARDHLLIVGGADLVPIAARAAAEAIGLRRAFERVVVLAPESAREQRGRLSAEIEDAVGDELTVELAFGDAAGESGFALGAAERAAAVLLMPLSSGPVVAEMADVETVQVGLALRDYLDERDAKPLVRLPSAAAATSTPPGSCFPTPGTRWSATARSPPCCALRSPSPSDSPSCPRWSTPRCGRGRTRSWCGRPGNGRRARAGASAWRSSAAASMRRH